VTAIFLADAAGAPMRACERSLALVDQGLSNDRYAMEHGFWRLTDACQVTLILTEDLQRAERRHGLPLDAGQHRRNLVISGLVGVDLRGRSLRIGEALLTWHRVRPPCGYLDRVAGAGMAKALGRYGGHCLRVRAGGLIRVGDEVTVV
jgi:MOSC domain-containing protein YiiM